MPEKGRPPQAIPSPISRHIITCYVRYQGSKHTFIYTISTKFLITNIWSDIWFICNYVFVMVSNIWHTLKNAGRHSKFMFTNRRYHEIAVDDYKLGVSMTLVSIFLIHLYYRMRFNDVHDRRLPCHKNGKALVFVSPKCNLNVINQLLYRNFNLYDFY